jgi:hypothetical protein
LFNNIIRSFFSKYTISNLLISVFSFYILDFFGLINYNQTNIPLPYIIALIILIWIILELIIKRNIQYFLLLYFFAIPIQNWIVSKGFININIFSISLNFTLIFWLILFSKTIIDCDFKIKKIDFKFYLIYFIIFFSSILSLINSKNIPIAINGVLYGVIVPIIIILTIFNNINKNKDIEDIYKLFSLVFLIYNIFTFLVSFSTFFLPQISNRVIGVFNNPNDVVFVQIIVVAISIYFILYRYHKIYYLNLFISIAIILMSGSRSSIVILIVLFLIFIRRYIKSIKTFVSVNVSLLIVFIIVIFYNDFIINNFILINRFLYKGLDSARFSTWQESIFFIIDNDLYFLGIGIGNYSFFNISDLVHAHNSLLQIATTIGCFSSLLFHYLIVSKVKFKKIILRANLFYNLPSIIILTFLVFVNINSLTFIDGNFDIISITTNLRLIYLSIFVSIAYFVNENYYKITEK